MAEPRLYINPKVKDKTGLCAVYLVVNIDYKKLRFPTSVAVDPERWDNKQGSISGTSKKIKDDNLVIKQCMAKLNDIMVRYRLQNAQLTPELLQNEWKNPARRIDFYAFFNSPHRLRNSD